MTQFFRNLYDALFSIYMASQQQTSYFFTRYKVVATSRLWLQSSKFISSVTVLSRGRASCESFLFVDPNSGCCVSLTNKQNNHNPAYVGHGAIRR